MADAEPTLTHEVRARALRTLRAAVASRRIAPQAVQAAANDGDAGIASLLRRHIGVPRPQVARSNLPTPQAGKPSPEVIRALHPWVRMLAAEGHLDAAALRSLSDPSLTVAGLCRVMFTAWEQMKQAVLRSGALPAALPEDMRPYLDVGPILFEHLLRTPHESEEEATPRVEITNCAVSFFALRAVGEDYRALAGMLTALSSETRLPLISTPEYAIEEFFPWMEELFSDLENVVQWSEDGRANLPADAAERMMEEGFGFDPEDPESISDLQVHLEWRRKRRAEPVYAPGSAQALAWLESAGDSQQANVYRALDALRACLKEPRAPKLHGEFTEGTFGVVGAYMPTACGIEERVEGWVNEMLNSGEGESTLRVALPAKPAQMGSAVRRVLTEVAVANCVAALIETL
jgi:hypothetical protein